MCNIVVYSFNLTNIKSVQHFLIDCKLLIKVINIISENLNLIYIERVFFIQFKLMFTV